MRGRRNQEDGRRRPGASTPTAEGSSLADLVLPPARLFGHPGARSRTELLAARGRGVDGFSDFMTCFATLTATSSEGHEREEDVDEDRLASILRVDAQSASPHRSDDCVPSF